jgi:hypothetical protein
VVPDWLGRPAPDREPGSRGHDDPGTYGSTPRVAHAICWGVFINEAMSLAVPVAIAQQRLYEVPLLEDALRVASLAACSDTGFDASGHGTSGLAVLSLPPRQRGATTVVPIRWLDAGADSNSVPPLDANIELSGTPDGTATLALLASCRLPGKERAIARALLHHIARIVSPVEMPGAESAPDLEALDVSGRWSRQSVGVRH